MCYGGVVLYLIERPDVLPFPKDSGLGWAEFDLLRLLGMMPLAGVADLAGVLSVHRSTVYRRLGSLAERGYISSLEFGATRERTSRWRINPEGMGFLERWDNFWHTDWSISRILEVFPQAEWFYAVLGEQSESFGKLMRFRWFRRVSWDAAAQFEDGWIAFFWSGLMQSEGRIRDTFRSLGRDLEEYNESAGRAFPSILCFVVSDPWQRELVYRVARTYGLDHRLQVWCVSDGSVSGLRNIRDLEPGNGWVGQVLEWGGVGAWPLGKRLENSPWSRPKGNLFSSLMDGVFEWPGMSTRFAELMLRDMTSSGRVSKELIKLSDEGFLEREAPDRAYSYVLSPRGYDFISRRDRVNINRRRTGVRGTLSPEDRSLVRHERGLMDLMGEFLSGGLEVASGWRSWENLGSGGGIAPDGLVFLQNSPYGPGWHYVEYELRARGMGTVVQKLRGYGSGRRQDRWPLLMIVRDERVEQRFQEVGWEGNLRMVTATLDRLARFSVLEDTRTWSKYGRGAALG